LSERIPPRTEAQSKFKARLERVMYFDFGFRTGDLTSNSFHEKAGQRQDIFSLLPPCWSLFPFSQAASVAFLPSALFMRDLSLGASWAYSFQQVLLPDYRPLPPLFEGSRARS
jgi:hypothetical protein